MIVDFDWKCGPKGDRKELSTIVRFNYLPCPAPLPQRRMNKEFNYRRCRSRSRFAEERRCSKGQVQTSYQVRFQVACSSTQMLRGKHATLALSSIIPSVCYPASTFVRLFCSGVRVNVHLIPSSFLSIFGLGRPSDSPRGIIYLLWAVFPGSTGRLET